MKKIVSIAVQVLTSISLLGQQTWQSAYYPTNWTPPVTKNFYTDAFLQDYSYAGYHRGEKPIPTPTSTLFDVTKAPFNADKSGNTDATFAIQSAINAAQNAGGGVVYLPSGTYKLNPGSKTSCLQINKNNVVLKGDGVGKTFLLNTSYQMNEKAIISVSGSSSFSWTTIPTSKALLTKDVMNPVSTLSVDNPSLFQVGDLVVVRNTIGDEWITEHKETEWLSYGSSLKGIMFCRYITAVDVVNKTISIDVPVRYALKTRDAASVYKISGMVNEVGLQDFSIANVQHPGTTGWGEEDYTVSTNSAYDCAGSFLIKYNTAVNCWLKNVETYQPAGNTTKAHMLSNGVLVQFSKNVTVDNCKISYAQYGGGGGNGYAYRVSANETLISNSTASYVRHGLVFSTMWCSGNVFHKCSDIKSGFQTGNTGNMSTAGWGSDHHMHFSQSNLIDQCYSENSAYIAYYRPYGSVPKHNLTAAHTAFWNTTSGGTMGYCIWTQQSRYGYAIGTSGTSSTVFTKENASGSSAKTDPVDVVEGMGNGAALSPQSLYADQLKKRLSLAIEPIVIQNLSLINVSTGLEIKGFEDLPASDTLKLNMLACTTQNIYANVLGVPDSIVFTYNLNGATGVRKESISPYAMRGDGSSYATWSMTAGIYSVTAKAYKSGLVQSTKTIKIKAEELIIPGIIEAEDYNGGGEGIGYRDSDTLNQGAKERLETGVDVLACNEGGFNVGYVKADEWLKYTVKVLSAGDYKVDIRYATIYDARKMHIKVNGVNQTNTLNLLNTIDWQTYKTASTTITLLSGINQIEVYFESDGINFNYLKVDLVTSLYESENVSGFIISPNPVKNRLEIKGLNFKELTITNTLGQIIHQEIIKNELHGSEISIDVSDFKKGVYIIKIGSQVEQFLKE